MTPRWLALAAATAGCVERAPFQYGWDDRRVLCSSPIDDLVYDLAWDRIEERLDDARDHGSVAIFHAHVPEETISLSAIDRVLELARRDGLDFVRFDELSPEGPARAGLALSFDDQSIGAWYGIRDRLAAQGARVTLFVTHYAESTDEERAQLAELAAAGHGVEAHGVDHLDAVAYARDHGAEAYVADQILPSVDVLEQAGYRVTSFAFPFGASSRELEAAALPHLARVRVGPGDCPW
jgi:peptidoglycan/xylan/chitin deacetylase (PgdA/CDA1 family)